MDPSKCKDCGGTMKPLFTGFYCPKGCDLPEGHPDKPKAVLTYATLESLRRWRFGGTDDVYVN